MSKERKNISEGQPLGTTNAPLNFICCNNKMGEIKSHYVHVNYNVKKNRRTYKHDIVALSKITC